jgi:hypothetical protein
MQGSIRADQFEHVLTTLQQHYRELMVVYRQDWRSEDDKTVARQNLTESISTARQTVKGLQGTQEPQLRELMSQLTVQSELTDDSLKHPEQLRR